MNKSENGMRLDLSFETNWTFIHFIKIAYKDTEIYIFIRFIPN